MRKMLLFLGCLLLPCYAGAQVPPPSPLTYTILDLPDPGGPGRRLTLLARTGAGALLAHGRKRDFRVDGTTLAPTPIQCDPSVFPRAPQAARSAFDTKGMNAALTVVGSDQRDLGGGQSQLWAIAQTADGTCFPYLYPGSVGTYYTGISDAPGDPAVAGVYFNADGPGEEGLKRFHGFVRTASGVTVLDGPNANDRNLPRAWNASGVVVGESWLGIVMNSYAPAGFIRYADGAIEYLTTPTGRIFCPSAINTTGIVVGTEGSCGTVTGKSWWYDSVARVFFPLPNPTANTVALDVAHVGDNGAMVGRYTERIVRPAPAEPVDATHWYLALPTTPYRRP